MTVMQVRIFLRIYEVRYESHGRTAPAAPDLPCQKSNIYVLLQFNKLTYVKIVMVQCFLDKMKYPKQNIVISD